MVRCAKPVWRTHAAWLVGRSILSLVTFAVNRYRKRFYLRLDRPETTAVGSAGEPGRDRDGRRQRDRARDLAGAARRRRGSGARGRRPRRDPAGAPGERARAGGRLRRP